MRRALAAAVAALPLLSFGARADDCVAAPRWDDRCEAWTAVWDGADGGDLGNDEAVASAVDGNRAFAIADSYDGTQGTYDVAVVARRTDTGALLWQRVVGGPGADRAGAVAAYRGVVYVAASLDRFVQRGGALTVEDGTSGTVTVLALDAGTGRTLWAARLPGRGEARAIAVDPRGVYVGADRLEHAELAALDPRGRPRWTRAVREAGVHEVVADASGVVWSAQLYERGVATAFAQRLTASGRVSWTRTAGRALAAAVAPDGTGGAYVATTVWDPATAGGPGVGIAYQPNASTFEAVDRAGRVRWTMARDDRVTDVLAARGRLWLGTESNTVVGETRTVEIDARDGSTRRSVAVVDPRAAMHGTRLAAAGRDVVAVAEAVDRGTSYCLTYAIGPEGDEPRWVARWSQAPAQQDGCKPVGAGADAAGRVVVTAAYLYVPARWRAPFVANFRDVAMLAYDAS